MSNNAEISNSLHWELWHVKTLLKIQNKSNSLSRCNEAHQFRNPLLYISKKFPPKYHSYYCKNILDELCYIWFCLQQKQVKATQFTFSDALELNSLQQELFIHLCLITVHVVMQPWDLRLTRYILISGKRLIKGRKSPWDLNRDVISFSALTCYF